MSILSEENSKAFSMGAIVLGLLTLILSSLVMGLALGGLSKILLFIVSDISVSEAKDIGTHILGSISLIMAFSVTASLSGESIFINNSVLFAINISLGIWLNSILFPDDPTPGWYYVWSGVYS